MGYSNLHTPVQTVTWTNICNLHTCTCCIHVHVDAHVDLHVHCTLYIHEGNRPVYIRKECNYTFV